MSVMNINEIFDKPQLSDSDALLFLENLIGNLKLFDRDIARPYGADPRPKHLEIQLRRGHVTMEQLRKAVHQKLIDLGREQRDYLVRTGTYADHCLSPEALGYAMTHADDKAERWNGIRYDYGDSPDTFRKKGRGLLDSVVEQLLPAFDAPRMRVILSPSWLLNG